VSLPIQSTFGNFYLLKILIKIKLKKSTSVGTIYSTPGSGVDSSSSPMNKLSGIKFPFNKNNIHTDNFYSEPFFNKNYMILTV